MGRVSRLGLVGGFLYTCVDFDNSKNKHEVVIRPWYLRAGRQQCPAYFCIDRRTIIASSTNVLVHKPAMEVASKEVVDEALFLTTFVRPSRLVFEHHIIIPSTLHTVVLFLWV